MSDVEGVDADKEECLKKLWEKDKLGRRADADFLIRFLTRRIEERGEQGQQRSYVLNIDASWGGGKTFFLERFGDHLEREGYLVARVNAWEDDHCEDPLIAVMTAVNTVLEECLNSDVALQQTRSKMMSNAGKLAWAFSKGVIAHASSKIVGEVATEVIQAAVGGDENTSSGLEERVEAGVHSTIQKGTRDRETNSVFEDFEEQKTLITRFSNELKELLVTDATTNKSSKLKEERKTPLFILVDEMDRCRPPYAIALLERVKHLFNIDNVIFVFATDTAQLSHSIKAVYGEGYDGHRYLHRFFDQTFRFPVPSIKEFVSSLAPMREISSADLNVPGGGGIENFSVKFFQNLNLPLRDIAQCLDIFHSVVTAWDKKYSPIHAIVMLPLIVAFQNGLELQLNEELPNKILAMLTEKTSVQMNWKIECYDYSQDAPEKVVWWDYFAALVDMGAKSTVELTEFLQSNPTPIWKYNCGHELLLEYNSVERGWRGRGNQPCHPSMKQYFNAISSAGRLGSSRTD